MPWFQLCKGILEASSIWQGSTHQPFRDGPVQG